MAAIRPRCAILAAVEADTVQTARSDPTTFSPDLDGSGTVSARRRQTATRPGGVGDSDLRRLTAQRPRQVTSGLRDAPAEGVAATEGFAPAAAPSTGARRVRPPVRAARAEESKCSRTHQATDIPEPAPPTSQHRRPDADAPTAAGRQEGRRQEGRGQEDRRQEGRGEEGAGQEGGHQEGRRRRSRPLRLAEVAATADGAEPEAKPAKKRRQEGRGARRRPPRRPRPRGRAGDEPRRARPTPTRPGRPRTAVLFQATRADHPAAAYPQDGRGRRGAARRAVDQAAGRRRGRRPARRRRPGRG